MSAALAARVRVMIEGITARPVLFADRRRLRQVIAAFQIGAVVEDRVPGAGVCAAATAVIVNVELACAFVTNLGRRRCGSGARLYESNDPFR